MSVVHMIVGAPTSGGATMVAKVDGGGPVRVVLAQAEPVDGAPIASPVYSSSVAVDAQGVAKIAVTGLDPNTRYWWRIEDNAVEDTSVTGQFWTAPPAGLPASFTFACAGDAGAGDSGFVTDRVSEHPVFPKILEHSPRFFIHPGDFNYRDPGSGVHTPLPVTEDTYRDGYDDVLTFNGTLGTNAPQQVLYRNCPLVYTWDNHDFGFVVGSSTDSDGNLPHKTEARLAYQERIPHYPLGAGSGDVPIYHTFVYGRVRFIVLDCRSERSPNTDPDDASKTMLGAAQKAWLETILATATEKALCVVNSGQWINQPAETDTWQGYNTERAEVVGWFEQYGWLNKMFMLTASMHALGLDRGTGNTWGGFPVALFAALDAGGAVPLYGYYDQGPTQPGHGQYGTVDIEDLGSVIAVTLTGWHYLDGEWGSIRFGIATGESSTSAAEVTEVVSGSHRVKVEARIITEYQTGPEPDGELIDVTGGDVAWDATAEIWSNASVTTPGMDEDDQSSLFPRRAGDLLAPYGNEIHLRYGIDLGASMLWTPLGYYRIDDTDQQGRALGPITLTGQDRMIGIKDARLLVPRQYRSTQSAMAMAYDLTSDVYPDIIIVWDDETDQLPIGRDILVERDRYAALGDLAKSKGKVVYFDSLGVLRFETPPDAGAIVWDIAAGENGVLVTSDRSVSREGMANAIAARGQGTTGESAFAVAVDAGPNSPTRWGSRFGKVPEFYESPLITTDAQAFAAAAAQLRRTLGMPYSASFGTVPNPALRPREAVRVTQETGDREKHIVETLRLPLVGGVMTGTTREQTLVQVGRLDIASGQVGAA